MELISILSDLIAIPSHLYEEPVQVYLRQRLEELGFRTRFQEVSPGRPNLVASRGEPPGRLLLCTHADTFPPYGMRRPFLLRQRKGVLHGRGVVDAKGQIAALLVALSASRASCQVAITVDEERSGRGSAELDVEADEAIVLEPTGLELAVAQAGFLEVVLGVPGAPSHGAVPEAGVNAIKRAMEFHDHLLGLAFLRARHPLFPEAWTNLGAIRGGLNPNVVPGSCHMRLDLAVLPGVSIEDAEAELAAWAIEHGLAVKVIDRAPPFESPPTMRAIDAITRAVQQVDGRDVPLTGMRSWTDAEPLVKRGIPSVVFGAGELSVAHSRAERVSLDELHRLARVLAHAIDSW